MVNDELDPEIDAVTPSEVEVTELESVVHAVRPQTNGSAKSSTFDRQPSLKAAITVDLRSDHRQLLRIVTALILATLLAEWIYLTTQRPKPIPIERGASFSNQFQVEVNSATWVEWLQLEGIGPSLAHRIVADRRLNGPFASIDDLTRVPGIGRTTLDRIRRWLTIRHDLSDANLSENSPTGRPGQQRANDQRQSPAF